MKKKKLKRVNAKDYPLSKETQRDHDRIHREAPHDPEIRREGRRVMRELKDRRKKFADVTTALKEAREQKGLSLTDVEDRTGISKSSLSLLENGKGNPTITTLERIAEAIGVEILITVKS